MEGGAVGGDDDLAGDRILVEIVTTSGDNTEEDSRSRLDVSRYMDYVRDTRCGAIATFEGTTRDTFEEKTVVELRYEAYEGMAIRQMRSICASALSAFPTLHRVAVAHRLGTVPVGEGSVFIAASAVHRGDALDACRYVIDQLKASVPIWKKELYSSAAEVWKSNPEFFHDSDCG